MKSFAVHYKNVFPGGRVEFSESHLDAYDADNIHRIALRVGGGGRVLDKGEELGATDVHDLSPIPKNARVHKLFESGRIGLAEESTERAAIAGKICDDTGKVLSIDAYKKVGVEFDAKGNIVLPK